MNTLPKIIKYLKDINRKRLNNRPVKTARGQRGREASRVGNELAVILKKIEGIPVIVISYNNFCHVEQMTAQLNLKEITPIIIDNASTDAATLSGLTSLSSAGKAFVVFSKHNFTHKVGFIEPIYEKLPDIFAYTDPDLRLLSEMPSDFLQQLAQFTKDFQVYKAGCALPLAVDDHTPSGKRNSVNSRNPFRFYAEYSIQEWESKYWKQRISHSLEIYSAPIDTTFAVYNKAQYRGMFYDAVRVAGPFSAIHLPWFEKLDPMTADQKIAYMDNNQSTSWK